MSNKLLVLSLAIVGFFAFANHCSAQSVQKYVLSSFAQSNDSITYVGGQSMSGESQNPRVLHGYLPFQYSTLDLVEKPIIEYKVYPNPTLGNVHVQLDSDQEFELVVHDLMGAIVHRSNWQAASAYVDLNDFADGMYLLRIVWSDGSYVEEKLIKN